MGFDIVSVFRIKSTESSRLKIRRRWRKFHARGFYRTRHYHFRQIKKLFFYIRKKRKLFWNSTKQGGIKHKLRVASDIALETIRERKIFLRKKRKKQLSRLYALGMLNTPVSKDLKLKFSKRKIKKNSPLNWSFIGHFVRLTRSKRLWSWPKGRASRFVGGIKKKAIVRRPFYRQVRLRKFYGGAPIFSNVKYLSTKLVIQNVISDDVYKEHGEEDYSRYSDLLRNIFDSGELFKYPVFYKDLVAQKDQMRYSFFRALIARTRIERVRSLRLLAYNGFMKNSVALSNALGQSSYELSQLAFYGPVARLSAKRNRKSSCMLFKSKKIALRKVRRSTHISYRKSIAYERNGRIYISWYNLIYTSILKFWHCTRYGTRQLTTLNAIKAYFFYFHSLISFRRYTLRLLHHFTWWINRKLWPKKLMKVYRKFHKIRLARIYRRYRFYKYYLKVVLVSILSILRACLKTVTLASNKYNLFFKCQDSIAINSKLPEEELEKLKAMEVLMLEENRIEIIKADKRLNSAVLKFSDVEDKTLRSGLINKTNEKSYCSSFKYEINTLIDKMYMLNFRAYDFKHINDGTFYERTAKLAMLARGLPFEKRINLNKKRKSRLRLVFKPAYKVIADSIKEDLAVKWLLKEKE